MQDVLLPATDTVLAYGIQQIPYGAASVEVHVGDKIVIAGISIEKTAEASKTDRSADLSFFRVTQAQNKKTEKPRTE